MKDESNDNKAQYELVDHYLDIEKSYFHFQNGVIHHLTFYQEDHSPVEKIDEIDKKKTYRFIIESEKDGSSNDKNQKNYYQFSIVDAFEFYPHSFENDDHNMTSNVGNIFVYKIGYELKDDKLVYKLEDCNQHDFDFIKNKLDYSMMPMWKKIYTYFIK